MAKVKKNLKIELPSETLIKCNLVGTSDLILKKKPRSFELLELWKQTSKDGEIPPKELTQYKHHLWENLITSIHWRDPIEFHDDDWDKYTQEEWENYMKNNAPCLTSNHVRAVMMESFVSFGYKDKTKKNGTDLKRGVRFKSWLLPIRFSEAIPKEVLVPTTGKNSVNVWSCNNIFSGWICPLEISVVDSAFNYESLLEVLIMAGKYVGISSQRSNGYGRFNVEDIIVENIK